MNVSVAQVHPLFDTLAVIQAVEPVSVPDEPLSGASVLPKHWAA